MPNTFLKYLMMGICLTLSSKSLSQNMETIDQIGRLFDDFTFYSGKFITPAADAAAYQASSGWMTSPKKRKLFDVTLGLNGNVFFVPKNDRNFEINNTDLKFKSDKMNLHTSSGTLDTVSDTYSLFNLSTSAETT